MSRKRLRSARRLLVQSVAFVTVLLPYGVDADTTTATPPANVASISGGAFAGSTGLIHINIASGSGNEQANVAAISAGVPLSDALLATQSIRQQAPSLQGSRSGERPRVVLGAGVLARSTGLVQLNQTAGNGNTSANLFTMNVHP